jgi:hypothetical protein
MEGQVKKSNNWLIIALLSCCAITILVSFYFFYFKKNYDFIIESPCDTTKEECFVRDCTNPDDCPPNGLSEFKRFSLKASDFKYCPNEDCTEVCETGQIKCEQIKCTEDPAMGESCLFEATESSVESNAENQFLDK